MDLYLRKSDRAPEIYRVILKDDGDEVEIGSIHSSGNCPGQTQLP